MLATAMRAVPVADDDGRSGSKRQTPETSWKVPSAMLSPRRQTVKVTRVRRGSTVHVGIRRGSSRALIGSMMGSSPPAKTRIGTWYLDSGRADRLQPGQLR